MYEREFCVALFSVYCFFFLMVFLSAWEMTEIPLDERREHLMKMQMA